jgi:hypothetical protein
VAKNYLSQEEVSELNRIVTMWLDFAEDQARRRKHVFLKDWETKLNDFLRFNFLVDFRFLGNFDRPSSIRSSSPGVKVQRRRFPVLL